MIDMKRTGLLTLCLVVVACSGKAFDEPLFTGAGGAAGEVSTGGVAGVVGVDAGGSAGVAGAAGAIATGGESGAGMLLVQGGLFFRDYDGVTYKDKTHPATISSFMFDKTEVSVGGFRDFVTSWVAGWRPGTGSGKHKHVHDGQGLTEGAQSEQGWDPVWGDGFPSTLVAWSEALSCEDQLWGSVSDSRPVLCTTWAEAYAFCIWKEGFLPSETEWNYAASGGEEQRQYPWQGGSVDCSLANYANCQGGVTDVGTFTKGSSRWGQLNLAGNAWEWTLDWYSPYSTDCTDCAQLQVSTFRATRGGSFKSDNTYLMSGSRNGSLPSSRGNVGFRCARSP